MMRKDRALSEDNSTLQMLLYISLLRPPVLYSVLVQQLMKNTYTVNLIEGFLF